MRFAASRTSRAKCVVADAEQRIELALDTDIDGPACRRTDKVKLLHGYPRTFCAAGMLISAMPWLRQELGLLLPDRSRSGDNSGIPLILLRNARLPSRHVPSSGLTMSVARIWRMVGLDFEDHS